MKQPALAPITRRIPAGPDGNCFDPLAVVDERLRLIGLAGLSRRRRLCDADDYLGEYQYPDRDDCEKGAAMILEDSRT